MSSLYFTDKTKSATNVAEATDNVTVIDSSSPAYGAKITTGASDKLVIDICAAASVFTNKADANAVKVRVDVYANQDDAGPEAIHESNGIFMDDICGAPGTGPGVQMDSDDKKNPSPFFLHEVTTGVTGDAVRLTMQGGAIQNGKRVVVFVDRLGKTSPIDNAAADIMATVSTTTAGRPLINGGPIGEDQAIPEFRGQMVKTTGTAGMIRVVTDTPLYAQGGDGIGLGSVGFKIKDVSVPGGAEVNNSVTSANANEVLNGDGTYQYDISSITNVTDATVANKSFVIYTYNVTDDFSVSKNWSVRMAPAKSKINFDNKPASIGGATITVDADASGKPMPAWREGKKALVTLSAAPSTPNGEASITKYEARYLTRAQADAMPDPFHINFDAVAAKHPNQVASNTTICNSLVPPRLERNVLLTLPENSVMRQDGTKDLATRYGVFVRAYTTKDGIDLAGEDAADVSNTFFNTNDDASLGFFVSGTPAAPTGSIKTGTNVLADTTFTDTGARKDASMNSSFAISYSAFNRDQRGDNYDAFRYAVVLASDAQYGATLADSSFVSITQTYNGNALPQLLNLSGDLVKNEYNTQTSVWDARDSTNRNVSNGTELAIAYAFDNSNGIGQRTAWTTFTPSTMTNNNNLFSLDPSTNNISAGTRIGSGFGESTGNRDSNTKQLILDNNTQYRALDSILKTDTIDLSQDNNSIAFGFSQIDASNALLKSQGKAYKVSTELDGGVSANQIRYFVNKSAAGTEPTGGAAARTFGEPGKDLSGTSVLKPVIAEFAQTVAATRDTNRLTVSKGYDTTGNLTNLKRGQRYDICFGIQNINGLNDVSNAVVKGFAPMGPIQAVKQVRYGSAVSQLDGNGNATFDVSFVDLCGAAQHGGHLITKYEYRVTQYQGDLSKTVILKNATPIAADPNKFFGTSIGSEGKYGAGTALGGFRTESVTTDQNQALPGWPIKFFIKAVAEVASSGNNSAKQSNLIHNVDGVEQSSPEVEITIPGPILPNNGPNDEVRSLTAVGKDGGIKVSFFQPEIGVQVGKPTLAKYTIFQYDMSLTSVNGNQTPYVAMTRVEKSLALPADLQKSYLEVDMPATNGKAYVIAVHSHWKFGPNNDDTQSSKGVYSSNLASASNDSDVSSGNFAWNNNIKGYTLPAAIGPLSIGTGAAPRIVTVPFGKPAIIITDTALQFMDNGDRLSSAALIQIDPKDGDPNSQTPNNTTAFYLDLCGQAVTLAPAAFTGDIHVTTQKDSNNLHDTNNKVYDVSAISILGANWAGESNFVIVQNSFGSTYTTNIKGDV